MRIYESELVEELNQRRWQRNTSRRHYSHTAPPVDKAVDHAAERPHVARKWQVRRDISSLSDLLGCLERRRARGLCRGAVVAHKTVVRRKFGVEVEVSHIDGWLIVHHVAHRHEDVKT